MESITFLYGQLGVFATVFLGIFVEAAPFLMLGTLGSGLVEVFFNKDDFSRLMPRQPVLAALMGAGMGMVFPVCECGVVPMVRRLFRKGLPLSAGVAFLLAAPVVNPIVIASTLAAFGPGPVFFGRLGFSLLIASLTGLVFAAQRQPARALLPGSLPQPLDVNWLPPRGASAFAALHTRPNRLEQARRVLSIATDEFFEMSRFLIFGGVLAAGMQTFIPQSVLLSVGGGPVLSVVAMIALAILLSVCSTVDAFIALSFTGAFSTGSILAFLVFGPMVDIKSSLMFMGVFNKRTVAYIIFIPLLLSILMGVFINLNTTW